MRDSSHENQIKRWAEFVRDNPDKWKSKLKPFLDSQILMARRFYLRLAQTEGGGEKIKKIMQMRHKIYK